MSHHVPILRAKTLNISNSIAAFELSTTSMDVDEFYVHFTPIEVEISLYYILVTVNPGQTVQIDVPVTGSGGQVIAMCAAWVAGAPVVRNAYVNVL